MTDVRAWVQRYIDAGWAVVPILAGRKNPDDKGWLEKARLRGFTADDFAADSNIGAVPGTSSADRVDLDLDAPTAVAAAGLLPETGLVHGRPGKPRSHHWFRCVGVEPKQFTDPVDKQMLLEVRANNGQTVLPPSIHPSGEQISWASDREPVEISAPKLTLAATYLAIVALLAKHWPGQGSRHGLALSTTGFLGRFISDQQILRGLMEAVFRIGNDSEIDDRMKAVQSTIAKLQGDHQVTGGPRFRQEFPHGDLIADAILEWLGVDRRIDRMNERYAVLSIGNRMVVAEFEGGQILELWPFEEFKKRLVKEPSIKKQAFADHWLKHPMGRQHNRLVYVMPGSRERLRENDYNGYEGFTVEPTPGDWSKNRGHILNIICRGNQQIFEWVINWLAALFQAPGRHAWSAIVLQGKQGTGKGHFADLMLGGCFYPQQYLHLVGANQLTAEFNEHFSGKVLIFGDETCWGGEKQAAEKLKGLITEDTLLIHRKFLKAVEEPSALHIVMASNSDWPVAIPNDDRRFLVLDVAEDQRQNQGYFAALRQEFQNGGRSAMLHDLLQHSIDEAALRQPPDTDAKREVKERTFSAEEVWVQNWLSNLNGTWTNKVAKHSLYEEYKQSLPRNVTARSIVGFGKIFKRVGIEWEDGKIDRDSPIAGSDRVNAYVFPSLAECRAAFDQALSVATEWPSDDCPGSERRPGSDGGAACQPGQRFFEEQA